MQWVPEGLKRDVRSSVMGFKKISMVAGCRINWKGLRLADRGPLEGICHN